MGQVYVAGKGSSGQLGLGNEEDSNPVPMMVTELEELNIVRVKCSTNFTVFVTASGKVYTCGVGNNGRLGHGNEESTTLPTLITYLDELGVVVHEIAVGGNHVAALDWDGKVWLQLALALALAPCRNDRIHEMQPVT